MAIDSNSCPASPPEVCAAFYPVEKFNEGKLLAQMQISKSRDAKSSRDDKKRNARNSRKPAQAHASSLVNCKSYRTGGAFSVGGGLNTYYYR